MAGVGTGQVPITDGMNSVPPENGGAASGMLATLQNTGQQMSLAIFFTIVILGLSASQELHLGARNTTHTQLATRLRPRLDGGKLRTTLVYGALS
jgi:hypothetical protein